MHFYTEAPITSFFPRISASKKRKIHKELTPSGSDSNKRQRNIPRHGIESKAKGDKQEHRNSLDNEIVTILHSPSVEDLATTRPAKSTLQQTSESYVPLLQSLYAKDVTPQTPKPNVLPSRKKLKTSLQTPPPTNAEAGRRQLMDLAPTLSPFISQKSSVLRTEKALLPTPSTLGRSASHYIRYSGRDHCRVFELPHQDLPSPTSPQHSNTSSKASVPVSIPSSQSQLMANGYFEDEHELTPASTALVCIRPQLSQFEEHSPPNRILLNRTDEDSTSHANQMVVCSSQSQFLSPVDGSQSQENELRILSNPEAFHQSISSRKQTWPQQTLSDELFSVSVLQTSSVGSLDSEHSIKGITDIPCAANHGDDSATESEPEAEGKASCYQGPRVNPMQSQPYGFSSAGDLTSLNEDSQRIVSCYSQQPSLDLSLAAQTSSIASLPGVVKEFQSMFGSEDESYPPDFPTSLR